MTDWSRTPAAPVLPTAPTAPEYPRYSTYSAYPAPSAEWEYRLRALNRQDRFERAEDTHSKRLWCLMLTLMILCGASVLVAVLVAGFIFVSQN